MCPTIPSDPRALAAGVALLLGAGCGDALVDANYKGEALLTLNGSVYIQSEDEYVSWPEGALRIALFWAHGDGMEPSPQYEQAVDTTTSFPAQYTLTIYEPPPEDVLFSTPWTGETLTAVGTPLLYIDENMNEQWDRDFEPMIGGSFEIVAVYSTDDVYLDEPNYRLHEGFQRMWSNVNFCGIEDPGAIEMFPVESYPVDLWVGPFWDYLSDWDCDGGLDEWEDVCPLEDYEMDAFCEDLELGELDPDEYFHEIEMCIEFCY